MREFKYKDLSGQIFGKIKVVRFSRIRYSSKNKDRRQAEFECECLNCGKTVYYISYRLKSQNDIGCEQCKQKHRYIRLGKSHNNISGAYFSSVKIGAKQRNIEFDITIEDMYNLLTKQNYKCALTGVDITLPRCWSTSMDRTLRTASLDRKESNKGYTKDNIQWVHKSINMMKRDLPEEEFVNFCKLVYENKHLCLHERSRSTIEIITEQYSY